MRGVISFLVGALLGGLVGGTLALLLAPTSGEDLRYEMRSRVVNFQQEIQDAAAARRAELEQQLAQLRSTQPPGA